MFLIPVETMVGNINEFYTKFRNCSELLGYFPVQNTSDVACSYFSVLSKDLKQRIVPVFFVPEMSFDNDPDDSRPALFFKGCDDGSLGKLFSSRAEALQWLTDCPYVDFNQLYTAYTNGLVNLAYYN